MALTHEWLEKVLKLVLKLVGARVARAGYSAFCLTLCLSVRTALEHNDVSEKSKKGLKAPFHLEISLSLSRFLLLLCSSFSFFFLPIFSPFSFHHQAQTSIPIHGESPWRLEKEIYG